MICMLLRQAFQLAIQDTSSSSSSSSSSGSSASSNSSSSSSSSSSSISSDPLKHMEEHLQQLALDVEMLNIIQTTRYLHPRPFVTKCGQLSLLMDYAANPELHGRFIDMIRISPAMFCALLSMIEQNPVFQNSSTNGQAPVEVQLAVMLYRMGRFGNANDVHDVAHICGVSEGSVENFTERCHKAIAALQPIFVRPLTEEEKEREKEWVDSKLGFRGLWREGYLMYDGTIVVLYQRPGQDGTSYFTRSAHDASAFGYTCASRYPDFLFSGDEFAWGDSAYPVTERMISIHKKPAANLPENQVFDKALSRLRVHLVQVYQKEWT
ncbi:hypothetical protein DFH05DRAFT_1461918 [Lentinula detonsa]|uniref:DDE Tnp4 domain-containing protein n=1 Tax=Lentinula detonsa TaxID=2804962 RepID=A0A9W8NVN7_9AGAR|nr:hypothetical protein DFH05DRAFT_1461918 [Lentinula detonsa]